MAWGEGVAFGTLSEPDAAGQRQVTVVPLHSSAVSISVLTLGAALHTVEAPDRGGRREHIALHLPTLLDLEDRTRNPYLGATCGRWAGRIAGASYEIDGHRVAVAPNAGPNALHGGPDGFDRRIWDLVEVAIDPDGGRVVLGLTSPDGDQGHPGELEVTTTYELRGHQLTIAYEARTDAPTAVNLTNHAYWNLAGPDHWSIDRAIRDHDLRVVADAYLPVDAAGLPSAGPAPVDQHPFDLRVGRPLADVLAERPEGIDHSYAVSQVLPSELEGGAALPLAAELHHPPSGRTVTVATDQPAVHVYTGNLLDVPFARQAAVCLEAQRFPDAPNHPELGAAILRPGDRYRATTELTFGIR